LDNNELFLVLVTN